MSTLKFNTWQNVAGRTFAPVHTWVNFNGTGTVAIRDSLNVSSITDNGVGDYTTNFTTALANANYSATLSYGATTGNTNSHKRHDTIAPTTTALRTLVGFYQAGGTNTNVDPEYADVQVVGGI